MGYILIKPKTTTEEHDTENTNEQDESATCHLEDWNGCIEEADIHQLDENKLDWMWGGLGEAISGANSSTG